MRAVIDAVRDRLLTALPPNCVQRWPLSSAELWAVAFATLQLLLMLAIIRQFQLESRTFFNVMVLCTGGFVVHALLPPRYRLFFFSLISLASIIVAFGFFNGLSLISLGLILIGICHLPLRLSLRVLLLIMVGTVFAAWRAELAPSPWSLAIWPILASMFMFRIALYLHGLRHDSTPPSLPRTLAYFFMVPNVCFPLFPVVDYSTFNRTYYDKDAGRIYYTGLKWIARGLFHLLLYRFVYLYLVEDPAELQTLGDIVQFLLATFLLYLRVSGQFHFIVGVLHLFGFRLPDTHHLYFLASSFTDFWRRINIYWKDFMLKLVYYPSYFRLRRLNNTVALIGGTFVVFLTTWVLHSYQWFWLRGDFPVQMQDGLFWSVLAVLVSIGVLREMKRSNKRDRKSAGPKWSPALAFRTLGTFVVICVLWSLWSADSIVGWLLMWSAAGQVAPGDLWILGGLIAMFLLVAGHPWSIWEYNDKPGASYHRAAFGSFAGLACMLLIGQAAIYDQTSPSLANVVTTLQRSTLNARDASLQHKGYYENLDNASRKSQQLWTVQAEKPAHWVGLSSTTAVRSRNDFLMSELVPGASIVFMDQPFTVNALGMRDRERALEKPAGTYRIALLGPSHVMGSGVADGETFSLLLEERLNDNDAELAQSRFEVLNFGIASFSLVDQLAMLRERGLAFEPDVVIVTDSPHARESAISSVLGIVSAGVEIPIPSLEAIVSRTGVRALVDEGVPVPFDVGRAFGRALGLNVRMPWTEAERRLRIAGDDIIKAVFNELARIARDSDATPVFLALDNVADPPPAEWTIPDQARTSGLLVFDLLDLWQGRDRSSLRLGSWDNHPNPVGNELIADALYDLLLQHRTELKLDHLRDGQSQ